VSFIWVLVLLMVAIRAAAAKLPFLKLLEGANAGLPEPMAFDAEFLSLQNLEHRGGRVGARRGRKQEHDPSLPAPSYVLPSATPKLKS
jgi:hypothetical protein